MGCSTCGHSNNPITNNTNNNILVKVGKAIGNIAEGWWYATFKDKDVEDFAKPRIAICTSCIDLQVLVKTTNNIAGICKHCKCPPISKCRVKSEHCPINKW
jgi:hypothetical protein